MNTNSSFILLINLISLIFISDLYAQEFTFAAMSDSRGKDRGSNEIVLSAIANHLVANQKEVKFLMFMGDMVDGSDDYPDTTLAELIYWKKIMSPVYNNSNMVWPYIYPVIGNHETRTPNDEDNFRSMFNNVPINGPDDEKGLTYSFDYMNVHFVCVDTDRWYYGDPDDPSDDRRDWHYVKHLDWLENDLQKANERNVRYTFVFGHDVPFPIGGHLHDGFPNLGRRFNPPVDSLKQWHIDQRDKFWQILVDNKVTAYICGHEHIYGRQLVDGVYQIVAGGAGAPLYEFNPTFNEHPDSKKPYEEMSYNDAVPYYKELNYNYGPGKNGQRSEDFFGLRAFHYAIFNVKEDRIEIKIYGAFPKEKISYEMNGEIELIDKFEIKD
ncbi:MAG: metallophosphoesterase [Bacteroidetes bacterium]|nr:metallophosphoesterase [Bacteroidota bacterium]